LIQHRERFLRQAPVTLDCRRNRFIRKQLEVHALAQQRPTLDAWNCSHLIASQRSRICRQQLSGPVRQVQKNRRRLEQHDTCLAVLEYRNTAVGVQRKKGGLTVLAFIDAHMVQLVRQRKLFKRDRRFEAIGGTVG
jgi:hypothetical protein